VRLQLRSSRRSSCFRTERRQDPGGSSSAALGALRPLRMPVLRSGRHPKARRSHCRDLPNRFVPLALAFPQPHVNVESAPNLSLCRTPRRQRPDGDPDRRPRPRPSRYQHGDGADPLPLRDAPLARRRCEPQAASHLAEPVRARPLARRCRPVPRAAAQAPSSGLAVASPARADAPAPGPWTAAVAWSGNGRADDAGPIATSNAPAGVAAGGGAALRRDPRSGRLLHVDPAGLAFVQWCVSLAANNGEAQSAGQDRYFLGRWYAT
jgi:hypothetical protein